MGVQIYAWSGILCLEWQRGPIQRVKSAAGSQKSDQIKWLSYLIFNIIIDDEIIAYSSGQGYLFVRENIGVILGIALISTTQRPVFIH